MSDTSQGPGWWQASDGKWYPPEQAPGYQPPQPGGAYGGGGGYGATPYGAPGGYGGAPQQADLGSSLSWAWNKYVANIGPMLAFWGIFILIVCGSGVLSNIFSGTTSMNRFSFGLGDLVGQLISILSWVLMGVLYVALARAVLAVASGQQVDLGSAFQLSGPPLIAGLVFGAIIGVGLALCVIPGVVAYFLLAFTPIVAVAQNRGADSLSEALTMSTSDAGNTFLLLLVAAVMTWCTFGILGGVAYLALAHNYRVRRGEPVAP